MTIEQRPLTDIRPYDRNPRLNDNAVAAVAESICRFGFRQPIVVDAEGVIVCGHTRWKAARQLGLAEVPVHVATDLTPEQIRAYRLADNKTNELAEWNLDLLPEELAALQGAGIDWSLLGFDPDELQRLLGDGVEPASGLTDPDAIPEPPDQPTTQPGDLWLLPSANGHVHRLLCGDSGKAEDVDRLLDGEPIHLAHCDPPYGVAVEARSNNAISAGNSSYWQPKSANHQKFDLARDPKKGKRTTKKLRPKDRPLINDHLSDEEFDIRLRSWFGNIGRVLLPGRAFYMWAGWTNLRNYPAALEAADLFWHQLLVWIKNAPVLCRKDYMLGYEVCFYGWREGAGHEFFGPNNVPDVWTVDKVPQQKMVHLTEKPTELAGRAMRYSSRPGENVLDLFGGSGSTLIAAEQTQRRAFLMEMDPAYCDVIWQRWERFTGRKAELKRQPE